MLLIILALLSCMSISLEFHLDRQLSLCCMKGIKTITPLSHGGIAVQSANPSVTIFNGATFAKISQIQANSSIQKIIITSDGSVFFGNQAKIIRKATQNQTNVAFPESTLSSNMVLTNKYALVGKRSITPILKKVDLQKLKIQTYNLEPSQQQYDFPVCLSDIKNGQVVFGQRYTVYLLNNETLQVEQSFVDDDNSISDITSFSKQQDSVILIRRGSYSYKTYRYRQSSKKFQPFQRFYSFAGQLTLTSPTTAVSIYKGRLVYWKNFDQQIIAQSWSSDDYIGPSLNAIAVSNSEEIFAMINTKTDNQIKICSLTKDYKIVQNFIVEKTVGNLIQAKFSSDDAYLIYNQKGDKGLYELYKIDMNTKEEIPLMDGENKQNVLAFLVLGDNKLIVFMNRTIQTSTKNYMQLIDISTFELIHQLQVQLNNTQYNFRLIGNTAWNYKFILIQQYRYMTSIVITFKVNQNQIQQISWKTQNIIFKNTFACNQYMISALEYAYIEVYFADNMTIAKNITGEFISFSTFYNERDIFISQYSSGQSSFIFDFSQDLKNIQQGLYFRQYFNQLSDTYVRVLFPKRGVYLFSNTATFGTNYPKVIVYDLNKAPIKRWVTLTTSLVGSSVMMQSTTNRQCIWTFLISMNQLFKYDDCNPTESQVVTYPLIYGWKLSLSTNRKYIILVRQDYFKPYYDYTLQIRLTSNIAVYLKKITISRLQQKFQSIDITNDEKLVAHFMNRIMVFNLEPQQNLDNFKLQSIDLFDISKDVLVITGQSSLDSTLYTIFIKKFNNPQYLFEKNVTKAPKIIRISQSASRVALYQTDSTLSVWDIQTKTIIFQQAYKEVVDMKFINDAKILLQFASTISVLSLDAVSQTITKRGVGIDFIKIAANSKGNLIAALVDPKIVKIYDSTLTVQIAKFIEPINSTIADIVFTPKDQLYAVNADGTLFVLIQAPCPSNFINIDSVCTCPSQLIYANNQCIECSFMCSACDGSGTFDCTSFAAVFYIGIAGISVVVLAIIILILYMVKKKKEKVSILESHATEDKERKSENSLGEHLLDD